MASTSGSDAGTMAGPRETEPLLARRDTNGSSTLSAPLEASSSLSPPPPPDPPSTLRLVSLAGCMWILIFLQASNMSGMAMAQSAVAADLDAYAHATWFTSAYMIATASFAPLMGRLATVFSPAALLAASAGLLATGTVTTARATSLASFLAGRVVVGLGGGGVLTLSLITVLHLTDHRRRGLFVGMVNAGFTVGLTCGAIVYGALLPLMGWRTVFLVQAPLALLGGLGVFFAMPPMQRDLQDGRWSTWQKLARIDYGGAFCMTLSIVLLLYGLSGNPRPAPLLVAAAAFAVFVALETGHVPACLAVADPIIPLELLRSRGVLLSCLAQLVVMAARWTILFYAPIFMLAVRGLPPAVAGAVLVPTNAGFGTGSLLIGWLHVRRPGSFWLPAVVSVLLFASTLALIGVASQAPASELLAGLAAGSSSFHPLLYICLLFTNGFCTGAFLNYTLAHLLHLTRPSTHFVATSLLATFRGFSGCFGTTLGGGYFVRRLAAHLAAGFRQIDAGLVDAPDRTLLITRLVGSPALVYGSDTAHAGRPVLSAAERHVAVSSYAASLRSLYHAAALAALAVLVLQAATGWAAPAKGHGENDNDHRAGHAGINPASSNGPDEELDEEEIREAMAEHDPTMEV